MQRTNTKNIPEGQWNMVAVPLRILAILTSESPNEVLPSLCFKPEFHSRSHRQVVQRPSGLFMNGNQWAVVQ